MVENGDPQDLIQGIENQNEILKNKNGKYYVDVDQNGNVKRGSKVWRKCDR
jgi:hypothetical protein